MEPQWWSSYLVRYAVGSVLGALLVYGLFQLSPTLAGVLFMPKTDTLSVAHLSLWLVLGLAFCYLASAPILVLHAARFVIEDRKWEDARRSARFWIEVIAHIGFAACMAYWAWQTSSSLLFLDRGIVLVGFFLGSLLIVMQVYAYTLLSRDCGTQQTAECLTLLAIERSAGHGPSDDFVQSYRQLREHANAFLIVICEIFLAAFLAAVILFCQSVFLRPSWQAVASALILALLVWCLPASQIWWHAHRLERHLLKVNS
jgi:hypothetical protein